MKKIGYLLFAICMGSTPVLGGTLQTELERQVLTQEQAQYAAKQRFVMAVERFQFNAQYNQRDEEGYVKGTFEVAETYYAAVRNHSQLYAIELYGYLDRRMKRPWKRGNRTIAAYILKVLKQKSKQVEFSQQRIYKKMLDILLPIHQNRHLYFPLIWDLSLVRGQLAPVEMDAKLAQGEVRWEDLDFQLTKQMHQGIKPLVRVGAELSQARPEVLKIIVQGLQQDPLLLKGTPMDLGNFLVRYGMYSSKQSDGVILVKAGEKMLSVKN